MAFSFSFCFLLISVLGWGGGGEIGSGSKSSCGRYEQTPSSGPTACSRLTTLWLEWIWGSEPHACSGGAETQVGFVSHGRAVLVLLYSFTFSSPMCIFFNPGACAGLCQSLECDGRRFWTQASTGALQGCRVRSHSSNSARAWRVSVGSAEPQLAMTFRRDL